MPDQAASIDAVIGRLDRILDDTRREGSRLGYFPALYRGVTENVGKGIEDGLFDSPERMQRMGVNFANRYLEAYEGYRRGGPVTRSWKCAMEASGEWWPIVLQHLLLAMNAHINLDLGIAAARTSPGDELAALKPDFDRINDILAAMVDGVENELAQVWPALALLDRTVGHIDEAIVHFKIGKARDEAWRLARRLAPLDESGQAPIIDEVDESISFLARLIRHPGVAGSLALRFVRLGERGTVPEIIDILRQRTDKVSARLQASYRKPQSD